MDSDQQGLISSPRRAPREDKRWFALRATYNRELMVKDDLEQCGWECFVPMRVVKRERGSIVERRLEPSVHNLLFVHCTERELKEYKRATTMPVRYIMNRVTRRPLVVPDGQMRSFMAVANATEIHNEKGEVEETLKPVLNANSVNKAASFISFCDAFEIPVLMLSGAKGFCNCSCAERRLSRALARLTYVYANATIPKVTFLIGENLDGILCLLIGFR